MTRRTCRRSRRIVNAVHATVVVIAATGGSASAATYTWVATSASGGVFATTANWTPAGAPVSTADTAFFTSTSAYPVTLSANATAGSMTASAGTVTLLSSGGQRSWALNSATVNGGTLILGTASNPVSLNPLVLNITGASAINSKYGSDMIATVVNVGTSSSAATSTFTIDGSGSTLTANGGITVGASGGRGSLVLQNSASAAVGGPGIFLGDATSPGELRLLNSASFTTPSISAGVSSVDPAATAYLLIDGSSVLTINGAGTITAGASSGAATSFVVTGGATLNTGTGLTLVDKTATLTAGSGTTLNVNGNLTVKGSATFNPGTLKLAAGKTLTASGGGSVTIYNAYVTPGSSVINVDAGTLVTQELNPGDGAEFSLGAGSTLNITNGGSFAPRTLSVGNSIANSSIVVDGAGSSLTTPSGTGPSIIAAGNGSGSLTVRHGAVATFNDTLSVATNGTTGSGVVTVDSGGAVVVKDLQLGVNTLSGCTGSVNVTDLGSNFTIQGNLLTGATPGTSTITVYSGASLVHGSGTTTTPISAKIGTGGGTASLGAGTLLRVSGGSVSLGALTAAAKTIQLDSGSLGFDGSLTVGTTGPMGGNISLATGTALAMTGSTTINSSATVSLLGGSLATASIINSGTFNFSYGTLAITGPAGFSVGTGSPLGNAPTLVAGQTLIISEATTVNAGATLNLYGSILTTGTLVNNGLLTAANFASTTVNNGFTNASAGRLFVGPDLTFTANGPSANAGRITLQGVSARLLGTGTLTNTGVISGDGEIAKDFSNAAGGELRADAGHSLFLSGASDTANSGKVTLQGGTIEFSAPLVNGAAGNITGRGTLIAPAGITNAGQISLSAGISDVYGPVTNNNKVLVTGASTTTFYDPFINSVGASVYTAAGSSVVFLSSVTGGGTFTGTGAKYFSDGSSTTGPLGPGGVTVVAEPASLIAPDVIEQSVTVNGLLSIQAAAQGGMTSKVNFLDIGPSGTFDLSDTKLILDVAGTSDIAAGLTQIRQYLLTSQLFSSMADADLQHRLAIGYVDNAILNAATWGNLSADSTAVLTKLTYIGDANLDGKINADDYALLDRSFARSQANAHWTDGDFNYDGVITAADYLLIDRVYFHQGAPLSPEFLAARESQFGSTYVVELLNSVPEPAGLACLLGAMPGILRRRRRS